MLGGLKYEWAYFRWVWKQAGTLRLWEQAPHLGKTQEQRRRNLQIIFDRYEQEHPPPKREDYR